VQQGYRQLFFSADWYKLCGSRKCPYPHHRGSLEIWRGREVLKAKSFKGKYEPYWNFQRAGGFNPKNPLWGEYGHFLEQHISGFQTVENK